jgi:hypothetical protein
MLRVAMRLCCTGVSFAEAWASRVAATMDGRAIHFVGRDMLVRNKLAAGRPKDFADAARLKQSSRP